MKRITALLVALSLFVMTRSQSWSLTGNSGTNPAINFLGTTDNHPLRFRVNNNYAGEIDLSTGKTSFGYGAGQNNSGTYSVAIGYYSMFQNPGYENTAVGSYSLYSNSSGSYNTAIGYGVLYSNTSGASNTGMGYGSFSVNTTGHDNCAYGRDAMRSNTYGAYNVAIGTSGLFYTTGSQYNTAIGFGAGSRYNLGYNNTILGANCDGSFAGQYNIIAIGQGVTCPDNSTARIGNSATWSIGGYAGWSNFSDGRFKKDIKENVIGLDFIMKLRPVTYHLDVTQLSKQLQENHGEEWDQQMQTAITEKEKIVFTGFVAQEVEKAANETGFDFNGLDKPKNANGFYALRYAEFVVPLVKAMQEQQQVIQDLQKKVQQLQDQVDVTILMRENIVAEKLTAYPNPAINAMTVTLHTQYSGKGLLQIFDSGGKLIKQMNIDIQQGINNINLSLPAMAAGYYNLRLDWGNDMHKQISFVKAN